MGAVVAGSAFAYFARGLPSVDALRGYKPPQVTKVFCMDGSVCAEYFKERRTLVALPSLPRYVVEAFLAAEDADFYKHEGLDYVGMVRAALHALVPGGRVTGASTITQQACRNLLLSQERTLARKIREWILTPRIEKALTKDQILELYLNQIYFGHGRYGIEEAALFYFGKHAKDLDLGEAATLAGVPQQPQRVNPVTNVVRSKKRQQYVLRQLARHGFATPEQVNRELERPISLAPPPPPSIGPYYAEEIRKTLIARYGEESVLEAGLQVTIAMEPRLQLAADEAVRVGLDALDRRRGYRGRLGTLELSRFRELRPSFEARLAEAGRRRGETWLVADLAPLAQGESEADPGELDDLQEVPPEGAPPPVGGEIDARRIGVLALRPGLRVGGLVVSVDETANRAVVDLVGRTGEITFDTVSWAKRRTPADPSDRPDLISEVVAEGDLVTVRVVSTPEAPAPLVLTLDQVPEVQGALVALDPMSRRVVAMTGGYDFERSPFNRATQARRQPGSSFKPFLYGAAIESRKFTAVSVLNDAPEAIRDPYTGKSWKPHNYERAGFEGPMTLRQALTKSKNSISVRLIQALAPAAAIDFARRAGIRSPLPENLTLALGTGEVSVLEIANAYSTLRSLGQFAEPVMLLKVVDATGRVLEEHQAAFEERIPPPVAFVTTSLMRSVVEEGTATQVRELTRPAAGKTGTASDYRDAWFSGFTAQWVASAWVGMDDHTSLGPKETGGRAALPLWLSFMRAAHENLPAEELPVPAGVVFARIDPSTGLLAGKSVPGRLEPFLEGTQPTGETSAPGQATPESFFADDRGKLGL